MILRDLINFVVDDGIEAARHSYGRTDQAMKLSGAIAGFEACRAKEPIEIAELLAEAKRQAQFALTNQGEDYWYWRCRHLEIEWVANVVSAVLLNQGHPTIVPPTARGFMRAAEIVGTK